VKSPISFVYGNLVFGESLTDVWAAFLVTGSSYEWLPEDAKRTRLLALMGALEAIEADVQIARVGRRWSPDAYLRELQLTSTETHARANRRYVEEHAEHLRDVGASQPSLFLRAGAGARARRSGPCSLG
jgi:hypothetical protein